LNQGRGVAANHRGRVGAVALALVLAACAPPGGATSSASRRLPLDSDPEAAGTLAVAAASGPAAPATAVTVTASCPAGSLLVGGGVGTALAGGGKPPSSLHANGSVPTKDGWRATGATGGQPVLAGQTTSFALCAAGGPASTRIVEATSPGPRAARTVAQATASCPAGSLLVGGGGWTGTPGDDPGSPSLHLLGTFPSDATGAPAADGSQADSWTARAGAGGRSGTGLETDAYALCASWPGHRTVARSATRPGPLDPGGSLAVVASCPAGTSLLSGGSLTGLAGGGVPQQGLHLTGSYPSDTQGVPFVKAVAEGFAWGSRAEAGGQGSPPGTATTAFAVCLR